MNTGTNGAGTVATRGVDASVLFVSSTRGRAAVEERLAGLCRVAASASDITTALQRLAEARFDVCLIDLGDDRSAVPLIRMVRAQHPGVPIVAIADAANPLAAADAIYSGAVELLPWPFDDRELAAALTNAGDRASAVQPQAGGLPGRIFSQSPGMRQAVEQLQAAAASADPVAFSGEPGTGRELLARALHDASIGHGRAPRPFVVVDCAGTSPQDLERLLFGVVPEGRPGGADFDGVERLGPDSALASALGGSLVLRQLPEAPARVQARLARLLRDGEVLLAAPLGPAPLDIRSIAVFGPEPELDVAVDEGRLRADLADRFAGHRIEVPPLRRRREDIPLLAAHILGQLAGGDSRASRSLSRSAMTLLSALPWRGNVPELRSMLEVLVKSTRRPVIQLDHILEHAQLDGFSATIDPGVTLRDAKARFERDCISAVLLRHHGRVGEAAKALGIQRTNLYRKVRQLNVARSLLSTRK